METPLATVTESRVPAPEPAPSRSFALWTAHDSESSAPELSLRTREILAALNELLDQVSSSTPAVSPP